MNSPKGRWPPRLAGLAIAAGIAAGGSACTGRPKPPPAVLLVTLDTLRADRVGAYGSRRGLTPHLDRLAAAGARFEEAVASVPLTLPSHATLFTGLEPVGHGVRDNGTYVLPTDLDTVATLLKARGYATAGFVGAYVLDRRFGLARGFDLYDDRVSRGDDRKSLLEAERRGEEVVRLATAWLATRREPFFAWAHLYDPHAPYEAPAPFREAHPTEPYDAEVAYADDCLGRLVEAARAAAAQGGREVLVVVAADHGESLGEHGEATHGLFVYQSTLSIPLVFTGPGVKAGQSHRGPARLADVLPTLLGRLGLPVPAGLHGVDLFGSGGSARESYAESDYPRNFGWAGLRSLRLGSTKIILGGDRAELFDLAEDPREERDLAGSRPESVARLREALSAWRRAERKAARAPADPDSAERLRALGYVAATGASDDGKADTGRPHPKDRVDAYRAFEDASWAEAGALPGAGIPGLEQAMAQDPDNRLFRRRLAAALRRAGRNREAVALLDRSKDAGTALDWHERALALAEAGKVAEAEASERKALDLDPLLVEAHNHLGVLLAGHGKMEDARQRFEAAASLDPNNAGAWNNLANALRDLGRAGEAESAYQRAAEADPRNPDPWNGLGVLAVQSGRAEAAILLFEKALLVDPGLGEARLNLAVAQAEVGRPQQALGTLAPLTAGAGALADKARRLQRDLRFRLNSKS